MPGQWSLRHWITRQHNLRIGRCALELHNHLVIVMGKMLRPRFDERFWTGWLIFDERFFSLIFYVQLRDVLGVILSMDHTTMWSLATIVLVVLTRLNWIGTCNFRPAEWNRYIEFSSPWNSCKEIKPNISKKKSRPILLEASCMTLLISKPCATCCVFLSLHPSLSSSHLLHIRLDLVDCGRIRTAASFKEIIPTNAEPRYPAERVEAKKLWKIPVVGECLLTKGVMCNLHICRGKLQARLDLWFSPSLSYMFPQKIRCPDCMSVHHVGLGMRKHRKVRSQDSQRATSFFGNPSNFAKENLDFKSSSECTQLAPLHPQKSSRLYARTWNEYIRCPHLLKFAGIIPQNSHCFSFGHVLRWQNQVTA